MSGGSNFMSSIGSLLPGDSGSSKSLWNALDPGNISGHSTSSIGGNILDPGNVFGGNPQMGNGQSSNNFNGISYLPTLNGGVTGGTSAPPWSGVNAQILGGNPSQANYLPAGGYFNQMSQLGALPSALGGKGGASSPTTGSGLYNPNGGATTSNGNAPMSLTALLPFLSML